MTQTGTLITGLALSAALLLTACSEQSTPLPQAPDGNVPMVGSAPVGNEMPVGLDSDQVVNELPITLGAQDASGVKLNPPHGEPGHRCEIPVGAPLDGSAATGGQTITIPPVEAAPSPATLPVTMPPTNTAGKLNPPHGEPGHDCAVPVGSPLPG